jgi:acetyl esterase/lipase
VTGFFNAALVAHHCQPLPVALFSISGINTFRHIFFNLSRLLTPEIISHSDMAEHMTGPPVVGVSSPGRLANFDSDMMLNNGARNPAYQPLPAPPADTKYPRGKLYEYYTYKNAWIELVGDIDPGYGGSGMADVWHKKWPPTVIFHGDADEAVSLSVSSDMRDALGADKVKLHVAPGQGHLFEKESWIEDQGVGMDAVREAISSLASVLYKDL